MLFRPLVLTLSAAGLVLASAGPARAEIVFLSSGRTLSVQSHQDAGDTIVLLLRGGGEVRCSRALVDRIAPDEVPPDAPATPLPVFEIPAAYQTIIDDASARHHVDARLVRAVIQVESAYKAEAKSRKGAMGLMQLMPDTARRFDVRDPYDPGANIEGGTKYLKWLLERFEEPLAVAAYNAGEAAVERFRGVPPYAETRSYVEAVLKLAGRR
jgi:soluble lytic murein transglycosylase-like protein